MSQQSALLCLPSLTFSQVLEVGWWVELRAVTLWRTSALQTHRRESQDTRWKQTHTLLSREIFCNDCNTKFSIQVMNSLEILQKNIWFVYVINHTFKRLSLGREECGVWCLVPINTIHCFLCSPKRLLILSEVLGKATLFWVYTFTDLKTEIHWPVHNCRGDDCTKTLPYSERKKKEVLLLNFTNSGNTFCAGTWSENKYNLLFSKPCHWMLSIK